MHQWLAHPAARDGKWNMTLRAEQRHFEQGYDVMEPHVIAFRVCSHALCFLLVVLGLLILSMRPSNAQSVGPACIAAPTSSTISFGNITVPANTPNGTLLGSPSTVTVSFDCTTVFDDYSYPNVTIQVSNLAAFDNSTTAPNGGVMFQTSVPGIEVNLTATPNQASNGPNGPAGAPGWELGTLQQSSCSRHGNHGRIMSCPPLAATFTAQLVKVGTVTPGTFSVSPVAQFTNYSYGYSDSANYYATLNIGSVTVTTPACSVAVDPTVVILPTVFSSNFGSLGSTAGQTPFNVQLNCSASSPLSITLSPSSPAYAGASGVLTNTTGGGYAQNVGVQILDKNGNPISFGTAISVGPTINGAFNIPLQARYYQTGTPVSAGQVTATATYTLTYQ